MVRKHVARARAFGSPNRLIQRYRWSDFWDDVTTTFITKDVIEADENMTLIRSLIHIMASRTQSSTGSTTAAFVFHLMPKGVKVVASPVSTPGLSQDWVGHQEILRDKFSLLYDTTNNLRQSADKWIETKTMRKLSPNDKLAFTWIADAPCDVIMDCYFWFKLA